jgi:ABC-type multidrug transport system fused ATPase/permease subunit
LNLSEAGDELPLSNLLRVKELIVHYSEGDEQPALQVILSFSFFLFVACCFLISFHQNSQTQVSGLALAAGEVLGVTGSVGSGKSTMMAALLGELPVSAMGGQRGKLLAPGVRVLAVIGQVPVVLSGTVRDNITFKETDGEKGEEAETARAKAYAEAIWACGLDTDLRQLPKRDLTVIGDRGHTLSGGQRQRVALARVAYRCGVQSAREARRRARGESGGPPTIVLLDAPLSACDAEVSSTVFGRLMTILASKEDGRAVLMTTQSAQRLAQCDHSVCLMKGVMSSPQQREQGAEASDESCSEDLRVLLTSGSRSALKTTEETADAPIKEPARPFTWLMSHIMRGVGGRNHLALALFCLSGDVVFIEMSVWCLNLWVVEEETDGHSQPRSLYWAMIYIGLVALYIISAVMRHATIIDGMDKTIARTHRSVIGSLLGARFELLGRRDTGAKQKKQDPEVSKSKGNSKPLTSQQQAMSLAQMLTLLTERVSHIEGETFIPTELLLLNCTFSVVITVLCVLFVPWVAAPFTIGAIGFILLFRSKSHAAAQVTLDNSIANAFCPTEFAPLSLLCLCSHPVPPLQVTIRCTGYTLVTLL